MASTFRSSTSMGCGTSETRPRPSNGSGAPSTRAPEGPRRAELTTSWRGRSGSGSVRRCRSGARADRRRATAWSAPACCSSAAASRTRPGIRMPRSRCSGRPPGRHRCASRLPGGRRRAHARDRRSGQRRVLDGPRPRDHRGDRMREPSVGRSAYNNSAGSSSTTATSTARSPSWSSRRRGPDFGTVDQQRWAQEAIDEVVAARDTDPPRVDMRKRPPRTKRDGRIRRSEHRYASTASRCGSFQFGRT